jgi:UDP-glucose 4-epimerase
MHAHSGMNYTVLGGGGFLGSNLCLRLADFGANITVYGHPPRISVGLKNILYLPGEFGDTSSIAHAVEGADVVINLVGSTTPASSNLDKIADLQTNVVNTLHLLEACRAANVKKIVFASSGGTIYGCPDIIPTPETAETNPLCAYAISKLAIEKYLYLYNYLHNLNYVVLRIANPYGRFQLAYKGQGVIAAFVKRVLDNQAIEIWGTGTVIRDYVHVSDVIEAFIRALRYDGGVKIFNIGSGVGLSLLDLIGELERLIGRPIQRTHRESRTVDVPASILDISLAARELAWRPTVSLRDGLADTLEWMQKIDREAAVSLAGRNSISLGHSLGRQKK